MNTHRCKAICLILGFFLFAPVTVRAAETADLILTGGKIVTMDDEQPTAEAMAVQGLSLIHI